MHFYEFNIGDYAKKTQHLTNEEDLAYRRLLDLYYDTEKPVLSGGLATLSRRLRVDQQALENVLNEFFPGGKNKHADEKIAAYYVYIEKQKANGKQGGRPKHKPTANPPQTQNNPVPSQPLPTNHLPPTIIKPLARTDKKPSVHAIEFDFENGEFSNLNGHLSLWEKAYPAVNIQVELNKAAVWLIEHPKNRKSNYGKFLSSWLSRSQDKAPAQGSGNSLGKFI